MRTTNKTAGRANLSLQAHYGNAVSYSGYRNGQHPRTGPHPSDAEILEDLLILERNFSLIRMYESSDYTARTARIIAEQGLSLQMVVGSWLFAEVNNPACPWWRTLYGADGLSSLELTKNGIENERELDRAIGLALRYPAIVAGINVGNEALVDWTDHKVSWESMERYILKTRKEAKVPVSTADNWVPWSSKEGAILAESCDFVMMHTYPVWERKTIDEGIAYTIENVETVRRAIPENKAILIGECGWPSQVTPDAAEHVPGAGSEENQKRYYQELTRWCQQKNVTAFLFEAFDEPWKGGSNPGETEKHWGLYFENRKPKLVLNRSV